MTKQLNTVQKEEIRKLFVSGNSHRTIAHKLGLTSKIVSRYLVNKSFSREPLSKEKFNEIWSAWIDRKNRTDHLLHQG